jgi:hypothetical protein
MLVFLPGLEIAKVSDLKACPVGLASFHPVVSRKREIPHGEHRRRLKLFVGRRERTGLQVSIASLLDDIGHGHERVDIFPCLVHLGAQGPDLLFDLGMVFASGAFFLGWSDQSLREQRQDGLEDLFSAGLRPQYSSCLLHLAPFLSVAVSAAHEEMALNLLPGWPRPVTCKQIELREQLADDLIDGRARGIEQAQRLGLRRVGQADGERKDLCFRHLTPPVLP